MESPFPKSSSVAGNGQIIVSMLPNGLSGLETITYQYPLKLISPSPTADQKSILVFLLSYGGGLVGGDVVNLSVRVLNGARLSIVTQGHTKIFNSATRDIVTKQTLQVHVGKGAALCLLPDPVQPFDGSIYEQTQVFIAEATASLCLLDWVTQGRTARGENWGLVRWTGRNEIWLSKGPQPNDSRLLVRDTVVLNDESYELTGQPLRNSMHGQGVIGTLILRGQLLDSLGEFFLEEFAKLPRIGARDFRSPERREQEDGAMSEEEQWRAGRLEMERKEKVLWSAARVRGCVIVKFGAPAFEVGRTWIGSMLVRQGSISEIFGDQAMMCVR